MLIWSTEFKVLIQRRDSNQDGCYDCQSGSLRIDFCGDSLLRIELSINNSKVAGIETLVVPLNIEVLLPREPFCGEMCGLIPPLLESASRRSSCLYQQDLEKRGICGPRQDIDFENTKGPGGKVASNTLDELASHSVVLLLPPTQIASPEFAHQLESLKISLCP